MSLADYSKTVHEWCLDVEATAVDLFKGGVHPQECTGIAINIVESRRKKRATEQSALAIPGGIPFTRQ